MPKDPSKNEKPTAKRVRDTRQKGNVISSQDVTAIVGMVGGVFFLLYLLPASSARIGELFYLLGSVDCTKTWTVAQVSDGVDKGISLMSSLLAPVLIGSMIMATLGRLAQVGPYFEVQALAWKPSHLNPIKGVKQVLPTAQNIVKLLLVMSKVIIIGVLAYYCIRGDLAAITKLPMLPFHEGLAWSFQKALWLLLRILALFVVIAGLDFAYRRYKYYDDLMMSQQEVKDENRNTEGDPHTRGRQRQKMRDMSRLQLIAEVPQADAVVVNPTHVAVALRYTPGSWAPKIVAKGLRKRALRIKEMARKADVPIIHEPATARALYRHGKVGRYIPDYLFGAVAMILARLERMGLRSFASAPPAQTATETQA